MIHMDYIQEFVTLASRLSFSRASEDLFITQPSLSRHVSLLEAELGVRLVERNTRSVSLTQAGAELHRDFTALLDAYQTVQDHARALSSGYRGQIRISSPYYWIPEHIEPTVFSFTRRFSEIRFVMNICTPDKGIELVQKNKADIALGLESDTLNSDLLHKKIARERLCVLMAADHPCAGRESVSIRDFAGDKFIILELDESQARLRLAVQQMIEKYGVSPSRFIFTQNISTVGITIRQTGGVCILMDCFRDLGRDYLVSVPLSDPGCVLSLYLFRREDSDNEAAKAFFDGAEEID